ncbi:MAG: transporter associated domain-containing protein [Pseudomonadales bacterium]|jgi:magnesium and cobalt transporter|nr:CBS domain-containing protein [Pseudomonadales bacterium]MDG2035673.1 transporter associated domain-containing protein [Pseudomonadales bacterium]
MTNSTDKKQAADDSDKPPLSKRIKQLFRSEPKTTEDMVAMVDAASENEVIDNDARRIIAGALEVSEMHARDIMIPRTQMTVLKADDTLEENLQKIIDTSHSRYPVIGENIDEILGILLVKDLLPLFFQKGASLENGSDKTDSQKFILGLLRPAVFVPESKRLNVLLKQFREDRNHMALVIDEYGSLAGLVTIEDVLEEIVGEIEDEHDATDNTQIRKVSHSNYMIQALTPIDDFNEFFSSTLSEEEFDTIGGIITNKFGRLPKRNETVSFEGFTFHVTHADNRRLHTVRMAIDSEDSTED